MLKKLINTRYNNVIGYGLWFRKSKKNNKKKIIDKPNLKEFW